MTERESRQLEAAGAGKPKGRTYHCALESDGMDQVFDHLGSPSRTSTHLGRR